MKTCNHSPLLIACETVVKEVLPLIEETITFEIVDAGLHIHAERLKNALQKAVAKADGRHDPIVLGYGLCANAVVGLTTRKSTLIVPRVDDCIAMMLGSSVAYHSILKETPGTYFLSRGWIDCKITWMDEWQDLVERYGEARALWVQKQMFCHYKRLIYVDPDGTSLPKHEAIAQKAAAHMELSYQKVSGTSKLLEAMVLGPWDHRFVVNAPGSVISLSDFSTSATPHSNLPDG
jgi:hypothetical protein